MICMYYIETRQKWVVTSLNIYIYIYMTYNPFTILWGITVGGVISTLK